MPSRKPTPTVDDLIRAEDWARARALIEQELRDDPENHWLRTQLGVAHYEQGEYPQALRTLAGSAEIKPDCPLTLWNLAGTLSALGKPAKALKIYTWLLRSNRTAEDDPCWEDDRWADALRADCVFRAAGCCEQLGRPAAAEELYRRYLILLSWGSGGTYPAEQASRRIRAILDASPARARAARKVSRDVLSRGKLPPVRRLPKIDPEAVLAE